MGWTAADYDNLNDLGTGDDQWLRQPPDKFVNTVTPQDVRDAFAAYGQRVDAVLTAYAAGASRRFVAAVLSAQPDGSPTAAWAATQLVHLNEPDATGWALTGFLFTDAHETARSGLRMIAGRFTYWMDEFGPDAWLYVLAGITYAEALAMAAAGQTPTGEQLRVMAALNGHTLPEGI